MTARPSQPPAGGPPVAHSARGVTDDGLSQLARGLIGSEVLRIAAEVRSLLAAGQPVCNLTVGDFDAREFPAPARLISGITRALEAGHTNYPPSNGVLELRLAVTRFYRREFGLDFPVEAVLVAGGARPLIYATYCTLVDRGEAVAYPVPSWNNNHYCYLTGARGIPLEVTRESRFHPTPAQVRAVLPEIRMLAINTPLNPTGTAIEPQILAEICRDIVAENLRREGSGERPVFLMFDQVYWALEFGAREPVTPASLVPEVAPYTVMLDAISKSLAATGLRVGWSVAAPAVTQRMSDLLGHVGAWAPRPEQIATAEFLDHAEDFKSFRLEMQRRLSERLDLLYRGFIALRDRGFPIDAVAPEGTLYLSVRFDLIGRTVEGRELRTNEDIRRLLLESAGVAAVPFQAFGLVRENGWFRLSVGAVSPDAIRDGLARLERLVGRLAG